MYLVARFGFALSFVAVRMVIWTWVVYYFWRDLYLLYATDAVTDWLPVLVLYSSNAFLTFLQALWGTPPPPHPLVLQRRFCLPGHLFVLSRIMLTVS